MPTGYKLTQEAAIEKMKAVHNNKYTYENFVYEKNDIKSYVTCKFHGDFLITYHDHTYKRRLSGCKKCGIINSSLKKTLSQNQVITRMKTIWDKKDPGHYSYNNFVYKTCEDKSWITCSKHGDFLMSYNCHADKRKPQGCKKCSGHEKLTNNIIDQRLKEQYREDELRRIDDVKTNRIPIKWVCLKKECQYIWKATPYSVTSKKSTGCPNCISSKLEREGEKLLNKLSLFYKPQVSFDDLRSKKGRKYKFDFGVYHDKELTDLWFLIELHGQQHYEPARNMKSKIFTKREAEINFKYQKLRDSEKMNYTIKNKIPLTIISYLDLNNIKEILIKLIKKLK